MTNQLDQVAWYSSNTHLVEIDNLTDESTGAYINSGATVTADIYDVTAAGVVGSSSITLTYVAASNGKWRGVMPYSVVLPSGNSFKLRVTATFSGAQGFWNPDLVVVTRV